MGDRASRGGDWVPSELKAFNSHSPLSPTETPHLPPLEEPPILADVESWEFVGNLKNSSDFTCHFPCKIDGFG